MINLLDRLLNLEADGEPLAYNGCCSLCMAPARASCGLQRAARKIRIDIIELNLAGTGAQFCTGGTSSCKHVFRLLHMAHQASKSMENIEFLAVGQLNWRKARCYLRYLASTTWHLSTVSYTRALKKAHRKVLISR